MPKDSLNNSKNTTKGRKIRICIKHFLLTLLFIVICVSSASAFTLNSYLNKINRVTLDDTNNESTNEANLNTFDLITQSNSPRTQDNKKENTEITNIALFGLDGAQDDCSRSDCIMILTIDNLHNQLKLSSIIRDSYVDILGRNNKDKINHAYAFGGPALAMETLNSNFNLDIDRFVSVNFSSFPKIIDSLGGITLNITDDEIKYINNYINEINSLNENSSPNINYSGTQTVDGTQALAYSRIRYTNGGDFERSHRQRVVLEQVFNKLKTTPITNYPNLLNEFLPLINTNLSNKEILSLCIDIASLKDKDIIQGRFPEDEDAEGKNINGIYYYVFNKDSTRDKISNFIYENN